MSRMNGVTIHSLSPGLALWNWNSSVDTAHLELDEKTPCIFTVTNYWLSLWIFSLEGNSFYENWETFNLLRYEWNDLGVSNI